MDFRARSLRHYDVSLRRVAKIVIPIGLLGLFLTYVMLVRPEPRTNTRNADVVVVLAGESSRLKAGIELMNKGAAPVLVISNGTAKGWLAANRICAATYSFKVLCPTPSSDDTQGEARTISRLARTEGWNTIVLVSSNYHLRRAEMLFHRCTRAKLLVHSSEVDRWSFGEWFGATLEWPKLLRSQIDRSC